VRQCQERPRGEKIKAAIGCRPWRPGSPVLAEVGACGEEGRGQREGPQRESKKGHDRSGDGAAVKKGSSGNQGRSSAHLGVCRKLLCV